MATKKIKKLLIVEDDLFTLKLYGYRFREEGYAVVETPNASEALRIAKKEKPDLFIIDIMLQDGNGFEIIEELRKTTGFKKTPIIVLSNLGQEADIHEALNFGANEYFVKSNMRLQSVIDCVVSYLENRGDGLCEASVLPKKTRKQESKKATKR